MLISISSSYVWAAVPTDASVDQYIQVTQTEALLDAALKQPLPLDQMAEQMGLDNAQKKEKFQTFMKTFSQRLDQNIDRPALISSIRQLIQTSLTQEEVDASITFYLTPIGQSLLQKTPKMAQDMSLIMMPALQKAMASTLTELQDTLNAERTNPKPSSNWQKKATHNEWLFWEQDQTAMIRRLTKWLDSTTSTVHQALHFLFLPHDP